MIGPPAIAIEHAAIDQISEIGSGDGYFLPVPMVEPCAMNIDGRAFSIAFHYLRGQAQNFVAGHNGLT